MEHNTMSNLNLITNNPPYYGAPGPNLTIQEVADDMQDTGLSNSHHLQQFFDEYSKHNKKTCGIVSHDEFNTLLEANGHQNIVDEYGWLKLLNDNQQYTFYEYIDDEGTYYQQVAITNNEAPQ